MNILIYKGDTGYSVLEFYVSGIEKAFKEKGHDVTFFEINNTTTIQDIINIYTTKVFDLVIGYNGFGAEFKVGDDNLHNLVNTTFLAFYVDHPIYHIQRLNEPINDYIATFLDKSHVEYVDYLFPNKHKIKAFIPPSSNSNVPFYSSFENYKETKDIDVLFTGTYLGDDETTPWENIGLAPKKMYDKIAHELIYNEYATLKSAMEMAFGEYNLSLSSELLTKHSLMLSNVMTYARTIRRSKVINALCKSGLSIVVYGNNWENLALKYPNLDYRGKGSAKETIKISRKAKVIVNINTNFTQGAHERVFTAINNGAVVFSDKSTYYDKRFSQDESMLFYSLESLESDIENLKNILDNDEALYEKASKAYTKYKKYDTWEDRVESIIELVNYKKLLEQI